MIDLESRQVVRDCGGRDPVESVLNQSAVGYRQHRRGGDGQIDAIGIKSGDIARLHKDGTGSHNVDAVVSCSQSEDAEAAQDNRRAAGIDIDSILPAAL